MLYPEDRIRRQLNFIFGEPQAPHTWEKLASMLDAFRRRNPALSRDRSAEEDLDEGEVVLITYGDQVRENGRPPLQTLADFLDKHVKNVISTVHLLPFYPYSSDDGFSVVDYRQVNPDLGNWDDIAHMGRSFRLMFDAVVNHTSQRSEWFQGFLRGDPAYRDYYITCDPEADLHQVVRPRTLPLLTRFESPRGLLHVWTTFSSDQVDLNFSNPDVLLEMVDLLLFYVERGAQIIRLDAVAYLWKEVGTTCIHLPKTHAVVKLFRGVLDAVSPHTLLITETNVPHEDNISYFGEYLSDTERTDEAQLVYQFPLAPLTVHTLSSGNTRRLNAWAADLSTYQPFFNFIASHDGIGLMPARGLLEPPEIQALIDRTLAHGGQASYKNNPDGTQSVYELNISLYDLLNDPANRQDPEDMARFLASQAIMLSLAGVPGIYFHSLFGSQSCQPCFEETGRARSLNRQKFTWAELEAELSEAGSRRARVFDGYRRMLLVRRRQKAFHPQGRQTVMEAGPAIFGLLRQSRDETEHILCLINVTCDLQTADPGSLTGLDANWLDLLSQTASGPGDVVRLSPYQVMWLKASS
jgi:glucosylglycerate phosphorylase